MWHAFAMRDAIRLWDLGTTTRYCAASFTACLCWALCVRSCKLICVANRRVSFRMRRIRLLCLSSSVPYVFQNVVCCSVSFYVRQTGEFLMSRICLSGRPASTRAAHASRRRPARAGRRRCRGGSRSRRGCTWRRSEGRPRRRRSG